MTAPDGSKITIQRDGTIIKPDGSKMQIRRDGTIIMPDGARVRVFPDGSQARRCRSTAPSSALDGATVVTADDGIQDRHRRRRQRLPRVRRRHQVATHASRSRPSPRRPPRRDANRRRAATPDPAVNKPTPASDTDATRHAAG
jgi:hypothetical protein